MLYYDLLKLIIMKKYVFILLGILLISGCEKEVNENSQGYPEFHFVYFELFDVESKQFSNNQIEISHKMIMNNSKLEPFYPVEEQWFKMGLLELEDNRNIQLFGFSSFLIPSIPLLLPNLLILARISSHILLSLFIHLYCGLLTRLGHRYCA